MPGEESTTKLNVDISELKKEMQEAKRAVAVANSEFQAIASTMDDWSKSTDGISAKLKQLNSNVNSQKTILKNLEAQYAAVVEEQGKGSKAAQNLEVQINKQKATINKTEREIGSYEASLEEVSKAEKIAAKTGKNVSDVLEDMGKEAKETEGGFTILKGAIATFAGNAISSFVGSIKDGISNIMGLADETREYRTELAKMETAATKAGASTDYIKNKWHDMSAVLGDEGAVGEGLNNLMAAGYNTKEELDGITAHLEGAAIKWKDTLKFEGLADGLQETLATGAAVGPFAEMLERSGVNLEKFDEGLGKCKTQAEKQNYVLKQLSKLGLADVSKAYRETNADIIESNKANSNYQDTLAKIGGKIEPITTALKEGFNGLLQKVLELVEGVDMEAFTAKIEEGFAVLKDEVLPAVKDGFQWILDNKDMLIAGLAGIAGGFVAFKVASLINTVVQSFQAFKKAQEGATVAQWLMNAAMNANPIMIIVTVIAAVIAAIVAFIATNDDARKKIVEAWNKVKEFVGKAIDAIVKFFTVTIPKALSSMLNWFKELGGKIWGYLSNVIAKVSTWAGNMWAKARETGSKFINNVITFFKELPGKVWTWLSNVISKVTSWASNMATKAKDAALKFLNNVINTIKSLPGKIWTWLSNTVSKVVSWGVNLASKGKEAAKKLFNAIVEKVAEIPKKMLSIGIDIARGIGNGITKGIDWIKTKVKELVGNVTKFIKKVFKIGSPSKLMRDEVGIWLSRGVAVGIEKGLSFVKNSMSKLGEMVLASEQYYLDESTRLEKEKAEAEYQEKLKNAKDAAEIEKIKQERIKKEAEEAQQAYLEGLKTTAEKERSIFETAMSGIESFIDDAVDKIKELYNLQKSIADTLKGGGNGLTYQTVKFITGEGEETFTRLANVGADNKTLEKYNSMLDKLAERRGILPTEIAGYLAGMSLEDGMSYVEAMLNASDAEYDNYIKALAEKTRLTEEISHKLTTTQANDLKNELINSLGELPNELFDIGEVGAVNFGESFISGIGVVLANVKTLLSAGLDSLLNVNIRDLTSDILSNLRGKISSVSANISGVNAALGGGGVGAKSIINNYTQVINSPKAPNRVDLYRNTKNLLGLAGGGN